SGALGMLLRPPYRDGVRGEGEGRAPVLVGDVDDRAAQHGQRLAHLGEVAADARADLDLRAHELGFDLLAVDPCLALLQHRGRHLVDQISRRAIDEEVLLLDTERERRRLHRALPKAAAAAAPRASGTARRPAPVSSGPRPTAFAGR